MASTATVPAVATAGRSERNVSTRPLIAPSVIVLFLWMIVPLAMTLWFSFQYYNLLDPTISGFAGCRQLQLSADRPGPVYGYGQHALPGLLGAGHHGRPGYAARGSFRPGVLRSKGRATAGHRPLLRHADGERPHLEEHADAPGERAVRVLLAARWVCR